MNARDKNGSTPPQQQQSSNNQNLMIQNQMNNNSARQQIVPPYGFQPPTAQFLQFVQQFPQTTSSIPRMGNLSNFPVQQLPMMMIPTSVPRQANQSNFSNFQVQQFPPQMLIPTSLPSGPREANPSNFSNFPGEAATMMRPSLNSAPNLKIFNPTPLFMNNNNQNIFLAPQIQKTQQAPTRARVLNQQGGGRVPPARSSRGKKKVEIEIESEEDEDEVEEINEDEEQEEGEEEEKPNLKRPRHTIELQKAKRKKTASDEDDDYEDPVVKPNEPIGGMRHVTRGLQKRLESILSTKGGSSSSNITTILDDIEDLDPEIITAAQQQPKQKIQQLLEFENYLKNSSRPVCQYLDNIKVTEKDLFRLTDGEFLNDTIIDFYLAFLKYHLLVPETTELDKEIFKMINAKKSGASGVEQGKQETEIRTEGQEIVENPEKKVEETQTNAENLKEVNIEKQEEAENLELVNNIEKQEVAEDKQKEKIEEDKKTEEKSKEEDEKIDERMENTEKIEENTEKIDERMENNKKIEEKETKTEENAQIVEKEETIDENNQSIEKKEENVQISEKMEIIDERMEVYAEKEEGEEMKEQPDFNSQISEKIEENNEIDEKMEEKESKNEEIIENNVSENIETIEKIKDNQSFEIQNATKSEIPLPEPPKIDNSPSQSQQIQPEPSKTPNPVQNSKEVEENLKLQAILASKSEDFNLSLKHFLTPTNDIEQILLARKLGTKLENCHIFNCCFYALWKRRLAAFKMKKAALEKKAKQDLLREIQQNPAKAKELQKKLPQKTAKKLLPEQKKQFQLQIQQENFAAMLADPEMQNFIKKVPGENLKLFDKKFVIFPINEKLHWTLVVACNLNNFLKIPYGKDTNPIREDKSSKKSSKTQENDEKGAKNEENNIQKDPAVILYFDSLNSYSGVAQHKSLRLYLDLRLRFEYPEIFLPEKQEEKSSKDSPSEIEDSDLEENSPKIQPNSPQLPKNSSQLQQNSSQLQSNSPNSSQLQQTSPISQPNSSQLQQSSSPNLQLQPNSLQLQPISPNLQLQQSPPNNKIPRNIEIVTAQSLPGKLNSVPGQNNNCDCGVFLLHYAEKFVVDQPEKLPIRNFNWFDLNDIKQKRSFIKNVVLHIGRMKMFQPTVVTTNVKEIEKKSENEDYNGIEDEEENEKDEETSGSDSDLEFLGEHNPYAVTTKKKEAKNNEVTTKNNEQNEVTKKNNEQKEVTMKNNEQKDVTTKNNEVTMKNNEQKEVTTINEEKRTKNEEVTTFFAGLPPKNLLDEMKPKKKVEKPEIEEIEDEDEIEKPNDIVETTKRDETKNILQPRRRRRNMQRKTNEDEFEEIEKMIGNSSSNSSNSSNSSSNPSNSASNSTNSSISVSNSTASASNSTRKSSKRVVSESDSEEDDEDDEELVNDKKRRKIETNQAQNETGYLKFYAKDGSPSMLGFG